MNEPPRYVYPAPGVPVIVPQPGMPVAALALGICGLVFCLAGIGTLVMTVLATIFGAVSLRRILPGYPRRGMAVAGLVLGIVGLLVYLVVGICSAGLFLVI